MRATPRCCGRNVSTLSDTTFVPQRLAAPETVGSFEPVVVWLGVALLQDVSIVFRTSPGAPPTLIMVHYVSWLG